MHLLSQFYSVISIILIASYLHRSSTRASATQAQKGRILILMQLTAEIIRRDGETDSDEPSKV